MGYIFVGGTILALAVSIALILPGAAPIPQPCLRNLPSLTSLRAIAALGVFAYHLNINGVGLGPLAGNGYAGVAFFFVLSGFVLSWTYEPGSGRRFWRRRIARVYPNHATTMLIAAVIPITVNIVTLRRAVANALLLQAWFPNGGTVYAMNDVSWSLSVEAFFYLMFPLVFVVATRGGSWLRWLVVGAFLVSVAIWTLVRPESSGLLYHLPIARIGEFILGAALAIEVRLGRSPRLIRLWWTVPTAMFSLACSAKLDLDKALTDVVVTIPLALVVVAAAKRDVDGSDHFFSWRPLTYAGEISFAFYLVHELIILNLRPYLPPGYVSAFAMLVGASVAAVLLHHGIERPMQRVISGHARSTA